MWLLHSKWLSEWSNGSASNFALSLSIKLGKQFRWFKRLQLWATGDWQLHHDNAPIHVARLTQRFFAKSQITQVIQPSYRPDLVPSDFWLFPKLKSLLKEKRFQTINEIQENTMGQLLVRELCVVPRCLFWRNWSSTILCTMFLVCCIFLNKCLYFSYKIAGYFLDRPCVYFFIVYLFSLSQ